MHNCCTENLDHLIQFALHDYLKSKCEGYLSLNEVRYFEVDVRTFVSTSRSVPERQCMISIELGEFRLLPTEVGEHMKEVNRQDHIVVSSPAEVGQPGDGFIAVVYLFPSLPYVPQDRSPEHLLQALREG